MLQFNLMVLAFGFLAILKLRESAEVAMLDVFLPTLLLMPATYFLRVPHLPLVSCYDLALYPIGIAAIVSRFDRWRFQRTDLWIVCFVIAAFTTDYLNLDLRTAFYNLAEPGFLSGLLAYFMGKAACRAVRPTRAGCQAHRAAACHRGFSVHSRVCREAGPFRNGHS